MISTGRIGKDNDLQIATLAGGCFWCTEAVFKRLRGVVSVVPGYTGGRVENPRYEEVCAGKTGHAEAIQITFDPRVINFGKLLEVFWKLHDPTTLDRQGADVGSQYRSAIFYHNDEQRRIVEKSREEAQKMFNDPIVTEIIPAGEFYEAEPDHKDYYARNSGAPYCRIVIDPKIEKLNKEFGSEIT